MLCVSFFVMVMDFWLIGIFVNLWFIFSGLVGNFIEYYDWYVYLVFLLYFVKVFFLNGNLIV